MTQPSFDLPPDDFRDERWTGLLPWLAGYAPGQAYRLLRVCPAPDWWLTDSPALTSATASAVDAFTELAATLIADHPTLDFGHAVPVLPPALPVSALPVGTRARTTLQRLGVTTSGELVGHTVRSLYDVRGTGHGTVQEIVAALISVAALRRPATPGILDTQAADGTEPVVTSAAGPVPPARVQLLEDILQLAAWRHVRGMSGEPLINVQVEEGEPEQIQELVTRLTTLSATDILLPTTMPDPVVELTARLATLDDRKQHVLRERFLARSPRTLADIADDLSMSRERVRQIETQIKAALAGTTDFGTAVGNLLASMRIEIQPVAAIERLIRMHPILASDLPGYDVPMWLVLDRLDDYFEVTDGWAAAPDVDSAREQTRSLLDDLADEYGVVEFPSIESATNMPPDELHNWLQWCGIEQLDGHILTRTRSLADHAAGVLAVAAEPLDAEDILQRIRKDRTIRSLSNALSMDKRFTRTDRSAWALTAWDVEEYTSIHTLIGRAVDRNGGQIPIDELVQSIAGRFDVSPSSVRTYASSADFEIHDGLVGRSSVRRTPRKRPEDTRRLFRHCDRWCYRMTVTKDQLRGSGFPLPAGVAVAVGCAMGAAVDLTSALGAQTIRWNRAQPACGTIKRFLDQSGIREGQTVFLEFAADRSFRVVPVGTTSADLEPLQQALLLAGLTDVDPATAEGSLASVLGLPPDANRRLILRTLWNRGDTDIAEILEQEWGWSSREAVAEQQRTPGADSD